MKKYRPATTVLGFRVSSEMIRRLDSLAEKDHRTRSQMARLLIEKALRDQELIRNDSRLAGSI
ncbi:ribbon-helix-helix domain-containing protein [Endozoicomonas atrinae]|uniref:ribbon-helix-helix domain-containing protein n=1 Tax=Endozoicomonas atrinae TaxID=1333660 RepID=UPI000824FEE6|nr:ribbon-helix-helix protein, CopG family [Endozoicomonas atrinae]